MYPPAVYNHMDPVVFFLFGFFFFRPFNLDILFILHNILQKISLHITSYIKNDWQAVWQYKLK